MYSNTPIGTTNPGLLVIMIDQSESMNDAYTGNQNRAQFAALGVNRTIYEILAACKSGPDIRDRAHVIVIGYGNGAELLVGGKASDIPGQVKREDKLKRKVPDGAGGLVEIEQILPVWIEPAHVNGTPMDEGFKLAAEMVEAWTTDNPTNFPPIVINITDGQPNDPAAAHAAAQKLLTLGTNDGKVLLFNAHIWDGQNEINLPATDAVLPPDNDFAKFLFALSSQIPAALLPAAQNAGLSPQPGARGFMMNAGAELLTKLLVFGSSHLR